MIIKDVGDWVGGEALQAEDKWNISMVCCVSERMTRQGTKGVHRKRMHLNRTTFKLVRGRLKIFSDLSAM